MNIGTRIIELREKQGMTQLEFAKKVNINNSVMNRIEKGLRPVRDDELLSIAECLGVTPNTLLGIKSDGYYIDPETAALAEKLRTDPDMKILFSASKDLSPEEMQQAADYVNYLKQKGRNK